MVRGAVTGAAALTVGGLLLLVLVLALIGNGTPAYGDHQVRAAIYFTVLWSLVGAISAAFGAWQAAEGGAEDIATARLAGFLGPGALIVVISLASLGADKPGVIGVLVEMVVELAACFGGATLLARRLHSDW